MALSQKDRTQLMGLLIVAAAGAAVLFWMFWRTPQVEAAALKRAEVDSLQAQVNAAKADLREGSVQDLEMRVGVYERSLQQMRLLVPTNNEVTNLIDQVSTRAQVRGVRIVEINPMSQEFRPPFEVHRYRFTVDGSYDEIGELLTDVASLERIMVPHSVGLSPEPTGCPGAEERFDTCLRAQFEIRTFVKSELPMDSSAVGGAGA